MSHWTARRRISSYLTALNPLALNFCRISYPWGQSLDLEDGGSTDRPHLRDGHSLVVKLCGAEKVNYLSNLGLSTHSIHCLVPLMVRLYSSQVTRSVKPLSMADTASEKDHRTVANTLRSFMANQIKQLDTTGLEPGHVSNGNQHLYSFPQHQYQHLAITTARAETQTRASAVANPSQPAFFQQSATPATTLASPRRPSARNRAASPPRDNRRPVWETRPSRLNGFEASSPDGAGEDAGKCWRWHLAFRCNSRRDHGPACAPIASGERERLIDVRPAQCLDKDLCDVLRQYLGATVVLPYARR